MNQRVEEATAVTEAAIVEVEQETVQENGNFCLFSERKFREINSQLINFL